VHAAERWSCCVEATSSETASASNWSSSAAPAADMATTANITSLRLTDQSRARKQRDPIEFSFHDLDFLCLFVRLFLKFIVSLA
jgi:hypothetical protein